MPLDDTAPPSLSTLETPALVLDRRRMLRNIDHVRGRLAGLGVAFRPHLKTAKSIDAARLMMAGPEGPITVSTLREAEYFAGHGVRDILYAVGLAPNKLAHVSALRSRGVDLSVITDNADGARAIAGQATAAGDAIPVLVEIDADGKRAGLKPGDPALVEIGRLLHDGGAALRGVMTHAGGSYGCYTEPAHRAMALKERDAVVAAAAALRGAGLPCPVVSVGSTPTAWFAEDLTGVTEARPGVFVFSDLVMAGLGVGTLDDIALSVLACVIGHRPDKGWILTDAGWMALSRDRGTAAQPVDQGYGLVCDLDGRPYGDLIVAEASQEHGVLAPKPGTTAAPHELPVGTLVRILPNHACATAARFDRYHVVDGGREIAAVWERCNGW